MEGPPLISGTRHPFPVTNHDIVTLQGGAHHAQARTRARSCGEG